MYKELKIRYEQLSKLTNASAVDWEILCDTLMVELDKARDVIKFYNDNCGNGTSVCGDYTYYVRLDAASNKRAKQYLQEEN